MDRKLSPKTMCFIECFTEKTRLGVSKCAAECQKIEEAKCIPNPLGLPNTNTNINLCPPSINTKTTSTNHQLQ